MNAVRGRILFIGYDYHSYTRAINKEFVHLGYASCFHSIQPGRLYLKIARRLSSKLYTALLNRYHRNIIYSYAVDYFDKIIFLQVHQFSHENMSLLKSRNSLAKFTLYNWDAVSTHDYRSYLSYFNSVLTFDPSDARALGIKYLPLFCIREFQDLKNLSIDTASVYFVGNVVNPYRYKVIKEFQAFCAREGIRFEYFLKTTLHGLSQMCKVGLFPYEVSLRSLTDKDFRAMCARSAAVFDYANHVQSGFTMRVIENLCAGKKLITNNSNALTADFYSPDRVLVYSGGDFSAVKNFLSLPLIVRENDFSSYHIQNFAKKLLDLQDI